jgi:thiamine biosynthesis lipoprotein
MEMGQLTGGLFDVTIGGSIEHFKNSEDGPAPALCGTLSLDPDRPIIHCLDPGREIDLGGIGKGFALDQMKALMQDWGVDAALLAAGSSTQLAFGPETWTLDLSGDKAVRHITLENAALSASGSRIQGSHILHPAGKVNNSALSRVWVMCQGAARADAWSTALMLRQKDDFGEQFPSGIHYMGECDGVLAGNFPASS